MLGFLIMKSWCRSFLVKTFKNLIECLVSFECLDSKDMLRHRLFENRSWQEKEKNHKIKILSQQRDNISWSRLVTLWSRPRVYPFLHIFIIIYMFHLNKQVWLFFSILAWRSSWPDVSSFPSDDEMHFQKVRTLRNNSKTWRAGLFFVLVHDIRFG